MTKRMKKEFPPALKARDFRVGDKPFSSATIVGIRDVKTKFSKDAGDESTIVSVEQTDGKKTAVFANMKTINNLVEGYGEEDGNWIGKLVNAEVEQDPQFNNNMIVLFPITAQTPQ